MNKQGSASNGIVHETALILGVLSVIGSSMIAVVFPPQAMGVLFVIAAIGMAVVGACHYGLLSRTKVEANHLELLGVLCFFASTAAQSRMGDEIGLIPFCFSIAGAMILMLSRNEARLARQLQPVRIRKD